MVCSCVPDPVEATAAAAGPPANRKYQFTHTIAAIPAAMTIRFDSCMSHPRQVPAPRIGLDCIWNRGMHGLQWTNHRQQTTISLVASRDQPATTVDIDVVKKSKDQNRRTNPSRHPDPVR